MDGDGEGVTTSTGDRTSDSTQVVGVTVTFADGREETRDALYRRSPNMSKHGEDARYRVDIWWVE